MNSSSPFQLSCPRARRHLRHGWWALFAWILVGFTLELAHGFKIRWYLDVGYETRRLMLTLAHAHGALLAIINILAGLSARYLPTQEVPARGSWALLVGGQVLPLGFLCGGIWIRDGDPGVAILMAPLGALLVIFGVFVFARATHAPRPVDAPSKGGPSRSI